MSLIAHFLSHIILLLSHIKSLFDSLLDHSFQTRPPVLDVSWELNLHSRIGPYRAGLAGPQECAICLCTIEEGDETRELDKCRHVFHCVCIERWVGSDHWTCPLCRDHINNWRPRGVYEEIVVYGFVDVRMRDSDDPYNWWLR